MDTITLRSDRKSDYVFTYQGEETVLPAGKVISISGGLENVVLPTCTMKIIGKVIVIKDDVK